ncbi:putative F-box protein At1g47730 [Aristolochia californica]|uniref:putative F-box protein At1g47730 n=1 Tax=Aristolochia californica TaxID=171875 RepID=UPI0035E36A4B
MGITEVMILWAMLGYLLQYLFGKSPSSSATENLPSKETEKEEGESSQTSQTTASRCPPILDEIVFEILSWLPVGDVVRCKSVCKLWNSITSEPAFIKTHVNRAPSSLLETWDTYCVARKESYIFRCAGTPNGLVCFLNRNKSLIISNPAIWKSLRLGRVHHPTHRPSFCYIPSTGKYKVANFYYSHRLRKYQCEMITVGETEIPLPRREIQVPFSLRKRFVLQTGTMTYFIKTLHSSIEIATFDLETEVLRSKSFPWSRFNVEAKKHKHMCKFVWDGRLCLGSIVKNKLIAFVLEDYERDEWRKQEVVLPIGKEENEEPMLPLFFEANKLQVRVTMHKVAVFDLRNPDLYWFFMYSGGSEISWEYKPTLVTCKGMKRCFLV